MSKVVSKYIELHIFKAKNQKLKFLLLKRSPDQVYPGIWQMVTGKIKKKENAFETAIRELKEETGLEIQELYSVPVVNSVYLVETDEICLIPVFACKVSDKSIVKISEEHSQFKWMTVSQAIKLLAWEGQKASVRLIERYYLKEREKLTRIL